MAKNKNKKKTAKAETGIDVSLKKGEAVPVYEIKGLLIHRRDRLECGYDAVIHWESLNDDGLTKTGYLVQVKFSDDNVRAKAWGLNRRLVSAKGVLLAGPQERIYLISDVEELA